MKCLCRRIFSKLTVNHYSWCIVEVIQFFPALKDTDLIVVEKPGRHYPPLVRIYRRNVWPSSIDRFKGTSVPWKTSLVMETQMPTSLTVVQHFDRMTGKTIQSSLHSVFNSFICRLHLLKRCAPSYHNFGSNYS